MTTFLLLRHAHSTANEAGILAGRIEGVGLSVVGRKQAHNLVKALKDVTVDRIISSPLPRCVDTVTMVAVTRRQRIHRSSQWKKRFNRCLLRELIFRIEKPENLFRIERQCWCNASRMKFVRLLLR